MHIQSPSPRWTEAIKYLPPYSLIKALSPSTLSEAKQIWHELGRPKETLTTLFRHFDVATFDDKDAPYSAYLEHWDRMIRRWCDDSYLRMHAHNVDLVSMANEFCSESTWENARDTRWALWNMMAAAEVWNKFYRGKERKTSTGETYIIPATCRMTIMAGTVSKNFPRAVLEISIKYDAPIDYHNYTKRYRGERWPDDWAGHSGLWNTIEQREKLFPNWVFGECGPYMDSAGGWRRFDVLGGNEQALVTAMHEVYTDMAKTDAYKQGRILGQGAWYTTGNNGWPFYELEAGNLIALSKMLAEVWRPGAPTGPIVPVPPEDDTMKLTTAQREVIRDAVHAARDIAISLASILTADDALDPNTMITLTNQQVINLFDRAFGRSATGTLVPPTPKYIERLRVATGELVLSAARGLLYKGPSIDNMLSLSVGERQALIEHLP